MHDGQRNELTGPMRVTQERIGRPLGDYLRERYVEDGWTTEEIGSELHVNPVTVTRWLRRVGIEPRFPGQRGKPAAV